MNKNELLEMAEKLINMAEALNESDERSPNDERLAKLQKEYHAAKDQDTKNRLAGEISKAEAIQQKERAAK